MTYMSFNNNLNYLEELPEKTNKRYSVKVVPLQKFVLQDIFSALITKIPANTYEGFSF